MTANRSTALLVALPLILLTAGLGWLMVSDSWLAISDPAETVNDPPLTTAFAVSTDADDGDRATASMMRAHAELTAQDAEPVGGLSLSRQSFRRGGLGSKALMSFTVRNRNGFAVKDLEILCAFRSRDGSYATERRRIIHDTVQTRSRKAFLATHIGFINLRASQARCRLLTASRA